MAAITNYLRDILKAVYGREVRGAIHDAINAINSDVEQVLAGEKGRNAAEAARAEAERMRDSAEESRNKKESDRNYAELRRGEAEKTRDSLVTRALSSVNTALKDFGDMIDPGLDKAGKAADSQATGTELKKLESQVNAFKAALHAPPVFIEQDWRQNKSWTAPSNGLVQCVANPLGAAGDMVILAEREGEYADLPVDMAQLFVVKEGDTGVGFFPVIKNRTYTIMGGDGFDAYLAFYPSDPGE